MSRKAIQLNPKTLKKMAEALFLAYTAEQAAYIGGISLSTLKRIRDTPLWAEIERQAAVLEKPYREKIYKGLNGWQGAAWMLERKYPGQLSRPEIQLQLNASTNTTNNVLTITTEQAADLKARNAVLDEALSKLSPPASRANILAAQLLETNRPSVNDMSSEGTQKDSVRNEGEGAAGTRTPTPAGRVVEPNLTPTQNSVISSGNSKSRTEKTNVENSRNSEGIPPGGKVEKPQIPEGEVRMPKRRKKPAPKIVLRPKVRKAMEGITKTKK